ncbi:MAG TPA: L-threonylcarbamoyladenylate synthase [Acidimicrobiales bacterium]
MTVRTLLPADLDIAVELLATGAIVAIPTDTVYGLAARLDDPMAVASLFEVKRRPAHVPVAILVCDDEAAQGLAALWPRTAERLAKRFWPGPLTVVVAAEPALTERVRSDRGVGVRVPADELCLELLRRAGPLAVTSANLHGDSPAHAAQDVVGAFAGSAVAAVLDAGRRDGTVSTVVDLSSGGVTVVRVGAISSDEVHAAIS